MEVINGNVKDFVVQDTKIKGQKNSGTALELIKTTALIVNCTFTSDRKGSYRECVIYIPEYGCIEDEFTGGAIIATNSRIDISQSKFEHNGADIGGALSAEHSIINMCGNVFINNHATKYGGALWSSRSNVTVKESEFQNNSATRCGGGVLSILSSNITIKESEFQHNSATYGIGGVMFSSSSNITIEASEFQHNSATVDGGVMYYHNSTGTIEAIEFQHNTECHRVWRSNVILWQHYQNRNK